MANIYQIKQELLAIFDELEENGGELTPELEEQLNISKEEFRDKIKSYSNIVKMLENDITNIKEEKARLSDLQKSKEKSIERLKKIMVESIEMFGDTTKSGSKFIDFGIGKVSVRQTQVVEVEEDSIDRFANRLITGLKWYADNNQLDFGIVDTKDIIDYINTKSPTEEADCVDIDKLDIKDIDRLTASIDFDIDFKTIMSTKTGIDLIKALLEYNVFKIKAKADKKGIKDDAKSYEHYIPTYAKLVTNKSITIK
ncbi:MAG: siphovirus Gp157 family protein [Clostridia bacterium]